MVIAPNECLEHYGVGGMKWGLRRYQNPDGSLTEEGRKRYGRNRRGRAKLYTRQLRDNTNMQRSFMNNQEAFFKEQDKLFKKKEELSAKDPNNRKLKRLDKKIRKAQEGIILNSALLGSTQRRIDSIISDATANHYKISAKDVTRGNDILNKVLGFSPTTITEYKVKKTRYSSV